MRSQVIGSGVMRPGDMRSLVFFFFFFLFFQFLNDKNVYEKNYQYIFGDDLLIAPVLKPGVSTEEVYLPGPDDWVWLWDKSTDHGKLKKYPGYQTLTVDAPMHSLLYFTNPLLHMQICF